VESSTAQWWLGDFRGFSLRTLRSTLLTDKFAKDFAMKAKKSTPNFEWELIRIILPARVAEAV
jgi:hypothetical protein